MAGSAGESGGFQKGSGAGTLSSEGDSGLCRWRSGVRGAQVGWPSQCTEADGTSGTMTASLERGGLGHAGQGCVEEGGEAEQMGCMWTLL